jgi:sugar lactone lactonase YvrE
VLAQATPAAHEVALTFEFLVGRLGAEARNGTRWAPVRCTDTSGLVVSLYLCLGMLMGGSHPVHAIVPNPGDIVVADPDEVDVPGRIVRVDPDTCAQEVIADDFVQPYWVAIDPRGDLLVSDRGRPGRITRVDRGTGTQTIVSEGQFFGSPSSIAMAPSGELLVIERGTVDEPHNRILRLDLRTGVQTLVFPSSPLGAFIDLDGQPLVELQGIAVASNGDVFVVDKGNNGANDGRVIRVDQATGKARVVTRGETSRIRAASSSRRTASCWSRIRTHSIKTARSSKSTRPRSRRQSSRTTRPSAIPTPWPSRRPAI